MTKKFYQSHLMLRAGRPSKIVRADFTAMAFMPDGTLKIVASTNVCAITRDHLGWKKEFARATAPYRPMQLAFFQASPDVAQEIARSLEVELSANIAAIPLTTKSLNLDQL